jgi:hypothetical protein
MSPVTTQPDRGYVSKIIEIFIGTKCSALEVISLSIQTLTGSVTFSECPKYNLTLPQPIVPPKKYPLDLKTIRMELLLIRDTSHIS